MEYLRDYAAHFPSQGGVEIGNWLERYAAEVPEGAAIVEMGSWLGGGTAHLALGAIQSGAEIHVYDRFFCPNQEERCKAARYNIKLQIGEDTLPRVCRALYPFPVKFVFVKGSFRRGIKTAVWQSKPIGLYVDDLTKVEEIWKYAMEIFQPYFIAGKTLLVLMDYHFDEKAGPVYAAQKRYICAHKQSFEQIEDKIGGTSTAVFRYLG